MKKILLLAIVTTLMLTGCTTVKTIDLSATQERVSYIVTLHDGRQFETFALQVHDDSTTWTDLQTWRATTISTADIKTITHEMETAPGTKMWRTIRPSQFDSTVVRPPPPIEEGRAGEQMLGRKIQLQLAQINRLGARQIATITLANDQVADTKNLRVAPDTTSWFDPDTGGLRSIPTEEIQAVTFKRGGRGAIQGLGLGALIGGASGFVLGLADGDDPPCTCQKEDFFCLGGAVCSYFRMTAGEKAATGSIFLGAIGGLVGLVAGATKHSTDTYHFEVPAHTPPAVVADVKLSIPKRQ